MGYPLRAVPDDQRQNAEVTHVRAPYVPSSRSMAVSPTGRTIDPLAGSIGSSSGPPRWKLGSSLSQATPSSPSPQSSMVSPPPPLPVGNAAISSLGGRSSGGTP